MMMMVPPTMPGAQGTGVQIKVKIVSKSGPEWEQRLLSEHQQKVLVTMDKSSAITSLKEKLQEKFESTNLPKLNADSEYLSSLGIQRITGARIGTLCTPDGYDVDEDGTLNQFFGSGAVEMSLVAEVDLLAIQAEADCFCC